MDGAHNPPDKAFLHDSGLSAQPYVGVPLCLQFVLVLGLDVHDLAVGVLLYLHLHLLVRLLLLQRLLARLVQQGGLLCQTVLVLSGLASQLRTVRCRLVNQLPGDARGNDSYSYRTRT